MEWKIDIYNIFFAGERSESLECGAAGEPGDSILYTGEKKVRVRKLSKGASILWGTCPGLL